MTSSKWDSWKDSRIFIVFDEYLKNGSIDFHQIYVTLEERTLIVAMVTNSWGSAGLTVMIWEKKSGIFFKLKIDTAFLSQSLKSEA